MRERGGGRCRDPLIVRWISTRPVFLRLLYATARHDGGAVCKETAMDLWFLGLIVLLSLLTWGGIVLCRRLQRL
jgi:hypothetical protein